MSDVWKEATLGATAELAKGVTYAAQNYRPRDEGHVFLTIKCIQKGGGFSAEGLKFYLGPYLDCQRLVGGDLVIALTDLTRAGDIVGSPMLVPSFGVDVTVLPSMDLAIVRPRGNAVDLRFLAYRLMLHDARRYMLAHAGGTTVLHLETRAVPKFAFAMPPKREQMVVADILATIDDAIEQTEALIAKAQQIKAGLMHDLFTRGIGPDGQLRPRREEAPQLYKESPLGWIPNEWSVTTLGDCGQVFNGTTPSRAVEFYWGGAVPWLSSGKVNEYRVTAASEYVTERALAETSLRLAPRGSVLIGLIGQGRTRGMTARLEIDATINQNLAALIPAPGFSSVYLHLLLHHSYERLRGGGRGSNRDALNCQLIREFQIATPNFEAQDAAGSTVLALEEQDERERARLHKLQQMKAGLMHDLLTGRVRVASAKMTQTELRV